MLTDRDLKHLKRKLYYITQREYGTPYALWLFGNTKRKRIALVKYIVTRPNNRRKIPF